MVIAMELIEVETFAIQRTPPFLDDKVLIAAGGKPPNDLWFKKISKDFDIWAVDGESDIAESLTSHLRYL